MKRWIDALKKYSKGFQTYYLLVISIILLTLAIQSIIQFSLNRQSKAAMMINLAGKQRALSQMILGEVYACQYKDCDYADLRLSVNKLVQMDHFLKHGNRELGINAIDEPEIIKEFDKLYPHVQWFETELADLNNVANVSVVQLEARADIFYAVMDRIVFMLQKKSEKDIHTMMVIEVQLAIFSVMIVLFEIFFIVNPIIKRLLVQKEKLTEIAWHQSHVFEKHLQNIADLEYVLNVEKDPERRSEIYAFIQEELSHLKGVSKTVSEAVARTREEDVTPYERAVSKITDWGRYWLLEKRVNSKILDGIVNDPVNEEQK